MDMKIWWLLRGLRVKVVEVCGYLMTPLKVIPLEDPLRVRVVEVPENPMAAPLVVEMSEDPSRMR